MHGLSGDSRDTVRRGTTRGDSAAINEPQLPPEIEEYRDERWCREGTRQVETAFDAERFIDQVGFAACMTDSRHPGPSLYVAVCGRRDAVMPRNVQKDQESSLTWTLKDEILAQGKVYYAKLARGKSTFIAPRMIPWFHALWGVRRSEEARRLSRTARSILHVLRREWEMTGFGLTPPLPKGTLPTIANLVEGLDRSIHELGIDVPVDIGGNSLGGSMALEAARRRVARSVVAISPAGLWREHPAPHVKYVFGGLRFMARNFQNLVRTTVRMPLLRELALAVPISVGSRRMPVSDALRTVDDLATSPAFEETFDNTRSPFSGADIAVPVTVAFGDRDWILPKGSQRRTELPAHTRWVEKHGWGHVPMWVDPVGVAQLILEGTQ